MAGIIEQEKISFWFGYQVNKDQKHNWNGVKSFFDQIQKNLLKCMFELLAMRDISNI